MSQRDIDGPFHDFSSDFRYDQSPEILRKGNLKYYTNDLSDLHSRPNNHRNANSQKQKHSTIKIPSEFQNYVQTTRAAGNADMTSRVGVKLNPNPNPNHRRKSSIHPFGFNDKLDGTMSDVSGFSDIVRNARTGAGTAARSIKSVPVDSSSKQVYAAFVESEEKIETYKAQLQEKSRLLASIKAKYRDLKQELLSQQASSDKEIRMLERQIKELKTDNAPSKVSATVTSDAKKSPPSVATPTTDAYGPAVVESPSLVDILVRIESFLKEAAASHTPSSKPLASVESSSGPANAPVSVPSLAATAPEASVTQKNIDRLQQIVNELRSSYATSALPTNQFQTSSSSVRYCPVHQCTCDANSAPTQHAANFADACICHSSTTTSKARPSYLDPTINQADMTATALEERDAMFVRCRELAANFGHETHSLSNPHTRVSLDKLNSAVRELTYKATVYDNITGPTLSRDDATSTTAATSVHLQQQLDDCGTIWPAQV